MNINFMGKDDISCSLLHTAVIIAQWDNLMKFKITKFAFIPQDPLKYTTRITGTIDILV